MVTVFLLTNRLGGKTPWLIGVIVTGGGGTRPEGWGCTGPI